MHAMKKTMHGLQAFSAPKYTSLLIPFSMNLEQLFSFRFLSVLHQWNSLSWALWTASLWRTGVSERKGQRCPTSRADHGSGWSSVWCLLPHPLWLSYPTSTCFQMFKPIHLVSDSFQNSSFRHTLSYGCSAVKVFLSCSIYQKVTGQLQNLIRIQYVKHPVLYKEILEDQSSRTTHTELCSHVP